MEDNLKVMIKYQYFRQSGRWQQICKNVCNWVNSNLNLARLINITAVFCSFDSKNMVNVYYNDGSIPADILNHTSQLVLNYEIFTKDRKERHAWRKHNELMLPKMSQIANRGDIVAISSLENGKEHHQNLTIVWYKRNK